MAEDGRIAPKAFAVIISADQRQHAVWRGHDPSKDPTDFHRLLGGHIEFGELAVDTVVREIREELGAELRDPVQLGVVENVFTFDGRTGHEVVFVFGGRLEPMVVPPEGGTFHDGGPIRVEWRDVDDHHEVLPLYPEGVQAMIRAWLG